MMRVCIAKPAWQGCRLAVPVFVLAATALTPLQASSQFDEGRTFWGSGQQCLVSDPDIRRGYSPEFAQGADGAYPMPLGRFVSAARKIPNCSANFSTNQQARPPRLLSFDGVERLGAEAGRQRLLSEKLVFTLSIDAEGNVTDCQISRDFRRRAVEIALCRPFFRDTTFEPARDEQGRAIPGTYTTEVDFRMWMNQDGFIEPEAG